MKLIVLSYEGQGTSVFIPQENILISSDYTGRIQEKNEEKIRKIYFYDIIQGHWCDSCTEYENVKNRIDYKEIDTETFDNIF